MFPRRDTCPLRATKRESRFSRRSYRRRTAAGHRIPDRIGPPRFVYRRGSLPDLLPFHRDPHRFRRRCDRTVASFPRPVPQRILCGRCSTFGRARLGTGQLTVRVHSIRRTKRTTQHDTCTSPDRKATAVVAIRARKETGRRSKRAARQLGFGARRSERRRRRRGSDSARRRRRLDLQRSKYRDERLQAGCRNESEPTVVAGCDPNIGITDLKATRTRGPTDWTRAHSQAMGLTNRGTHCFNSQVAKERSKASSRLINRGSRIAAPEKLTMSEHNEYLDNLEQQFVLQTLVPKLMQDSEKSSNSLCCEMSALWSTTPDAVETNAVHLSGDGMGHQGDNLSQIHALSGSHGGD